LPIAGEEFVFEMTMNCLLLPGNAGAPVWQSSYPGERAMMKLPRQFGQVMADGRQLDEDIGQQLAEWARGVPPLSPDEEERLEKLAARGREAAEMGEEVRAKFWKELSAADRQALKARACAR
jgi:hypothetical protein